MFARVSYLSDSSCQLHKALTIGVCAHIISLTNRPIHASLMAYIQTKTQLQVYAPLSELRALVATRIKAVVSSTFHQLTLYVCRSHTCTHEYITRNFCTLHCYSKSLFRFNCISIDVMHQSSYVECAVLHIVYMMM
jgi:hypothetical protein